ncbi:MAG: D-amino-acid transaminase [Alphaproteobacteria bacterium]|nr:D-amino-acid transaminase [Alphaproteobacteria bacterium]
MSRIAYVNGQYVSHADAAVHVEDRGYQFSDGVYEVVTVIDGRLIDEEPHLDRLWRSLNELRIEIPMSRASFRVVTREMIRRNRIRTGIIYMQVTRGVARRDHPFPKAAEPAVVMTAKPIRLPSDAQSEAGIRVITIEDIRWPRRDIKSVSLLPNILGKQQAKEAGAGEAWQVDKDGFVTEGTSTNAWIVTKDNRLLTRNANNDILNGITRLRILQLAEAHGLTFEERPFTVEEAYDAKEAFISSSTNFCSPVTEIDDKVIGNGRAGELSLSLRKAYREFVDGLEPAVA